MRVHIGLNNILRLYVFLRPENDRSEVKPRSQEMHKIFNEFQLCWAGWPTTECHVSYGLFVIILCLKNYHYAAVIVNYITLITLLPLITQLFIVPFYFNHRVDQYIIFCWLILLYSQSISR